MALRRKKPTKRTPVEKAMFSLPRRPQKQAESSFSPHDLTCYFDRYLGIRMPTCCYDSLEQSHEVMGNSVRLVPGKVNTILVFPGQFRPPHRGHLDLLRHALHNAGNDLNVVAAVIIVDGKELRHNSEHETRFIVSFEKAAYLWLATGVGKLDPRIFLFTDSLNDWSEAQAKLDEAFTRNGVIVNYIALAGPETITRAALQGFPTSFWGYDSIITSDVSQRAEFCPGRKGSIRHQFLFPLPGCTAWENVKVNEDGTGEEFQPSVCHTQGKVKMSIRFVPCDPSFRPAKIPSSKELRDILDKTQNPRLFSRLKHHQALCPDLLAYFVVTQRFWIPMMSSSLIEDLRGNIAQAAGGRAEYLASIVGLMTAIIDYSRAAKVSIKVAATWVLLIYFKMALDHGDLPWPEQISRW